MKPPLLVLASVTFSTKLDFGSHATRSSVTATFGMGPRKYWKAEAWMLIWFLSQVGQESWDLGGCERKERERGGNKKGEFEFFSSWSEVDERSRGER